MLSNSSPATWTPPCFLLTLRQGIGPFSCGFFFFWGFVVVLFFSCPPGKEKWNGPGWGGHLPSSEQRPAPGAWRVGGGRRALAGSCHPSHSRLCLCWWLALGEQVPLLQCKHHWDGGRTRLITRCTSVLPHCFSLNARFSCCSAGSEVTFLLWEGEHVVLKYGWVWQAGSELWSQGIRDGVNIY